MMKENYTRRNFFKASAIGSAGLMMPATVLARENKPATEKKKEVITRVLGRTGIVLPLISCGKIPLNNDNLVNKAIESGIVHFDTAEGYDDKQNEAKLGEFIIQGDRESLKIATKIKIHEDKEGNISEEMTRENVLERLDGCLGRLQTEYVDILYSHAVSNKEVVHYEPMISAMKQAKEEGKVKFLGISTHRNEVEVIDTAIEAGVYDVILVTYNFKKDEKVAIAKAIQRAAEAGIGIIGMKSHAGGYLDKEKTKPVDIKAAMKWVLQNENIHTLLCTIKDYDKLETCLSVMEDIELSEEEKEGLQAMAKDRDSIFCIGCDNCTGQCTMKLPVADMMRAYMYTYGYSESKKAYDLLARHDIPGNPCADCEECQVNCLAGFDLKAKIADIHRLKNAEKDFLV